MPFPFFMVVLAVAFWGTVLGGGVYFLRRFVRALEHRNSASPELLALRDRVAALEAAHDETRSEIRQLTDGQEFTARLLDAKRAPGKSSS